MYSVNGMYRLLDLVSETGSGGLGKGFCAVPSLILIVIFLVDKIVISQASLGQFINELHAGAYVSMTKVDFKVLDSVLVKPVGVYGSKSEIASFLERIGAIDSQTYVQIFSLAVVH